jgi:hypothetical protein
MLRRHGVAADDVEAALTMIRAPRSLAGIVACCRRLNELQEEHSFLQSVPGIPEYRKRLDVLLKIASLETIDQHFQSGSATGKRSSETPLRPFTGDSGLCDLLLIQPEAWASEQHRADFDWLLAWYAWQVFHFQQIKSQQQAYGPYLKAPPESELRLLEGIGSRVYSAFLLIRRLGEPRYGAEAAALRKWVGPVDAATSTARARVLMCALDRRGAALQARRLRESTGIDQAELDRLFVDTASLNKRLSVSGSEGRSLSLLIPLFRSLWLQAKTPDRRKPSRRLVERARRDRRHLEVRRYDSLIAVPHRVPSGVLVELHTLPDPDPIAQRVESGRTADVDAEDLATEPPIALFLGDGDPVGMWYAAKSATHHIEAENAQLRWPRHRLSKGAIRQLLDLIEQPAGASPLEDQARLAIALSLVTGRSPDAFTVAFVGKMRHDPTGANPQLRQGEILISRSDHMLHVLAGQPDLKLDEAPIDPLPEFCFRWAPTIRLPLPRSWMDLVRRVASAKAGWPAADDLLPTCQRLLDQLRPELGLTEKAIARALRLALLEQAGDDLALVKVITDASGLNFQNVIHYASYPRDEVERAWRHVVEGWTGPLAGRPVRTRDLHVGAPYPIDPRKVGDRVAKLKATIQSALSEGRWAEAHNLLTVYVAIWLGQATAGRASRDPVPSVLTSEGWAVVRDKSRPDGSTDRYVPLTQSLQRQIEVLRALSGAFAVVDRRFSPVAGSVDAGLPLRTVDDEGAVVPYRPKHWAQVEAIRGLPWNWGRRLVRSKSPELVGRLKDAGLGHWVLGRHPWTWTSTLPSATFRERWLALQDRLERQHGFEVLTLDSLDFRPRALTAPRSDRADAPKREAAPVMSDAAIEEMLRRVSRRGEYEAVFEASARVPEAALWLIERSLSHHVRKTGKLSVAEAECVCAFVRQKTDIPLFVHRPRARFQRDWMVSRDELGALAYIEQALLPRIERDLASLPAVESALSVRIGRLMVASAVRGSVLDAGHLARLLQFLASDRPIEAVGAARMIELEVRSKRTRDPMRRTLLLEPYLTALFVVERGPLRVHAAESSAIARAPRRREACFRAYLRALDLPTDISLTTFLGGLRQRLMLRTAPVLAAYASGELLTHDLPVSEFRRLAGFEARPAPLEGLGPPPDADEQTVPSGSQGAGLGDPDAALPADLFRREANLARALTTRQSSDRSEWARLARLDLKKARSLAEQLLCHFTLYLLDHHARDRRRTRKLSERYRDRLRVHLDVVWAALSQLTGDDEALGSFDTATLRALMDLTTDYFPARMHREAWARFRDFLLSGNVGESVAVAQNIEFPEDFVSAKILSGRELDAVRGRLRSVQSNIGTAASRTAARAHFTLARALGARRAEIEFLRFVDIEDEALRIREYGGHTLKTAASERALPTALLGAPAQRRIEQLRTAGTEKLLDAVAGLPVSGSRYYDPLAQSMKEVVGDPEVGLHHLRHTKASLLALRMLDNAVDLSRLDADLPWLESSLPPASDVQVLLGSAGQSGQGLKAIAALLGHLHETTTLQHYIHTLCVALHAHQLAQPRIELARAFQRRLPESKPYLYLVTREFVQSGKSEPERDRAVRDVIERRVERAKEPTPGLTVVRASLAKGSEGIERGNSESRARETLLERASSLMERFEELQRVFEGPDVALPDAEASIRDRLKEIASIPTGKRGSTARRHPMRVAGGAGIPTPAPLLPGRPVGYARRLIAHLIWLRENRRDEWDWLVDRWLHASHAATGAMRLSRPGDLERARQLDEELAAKPAWGFGIRLRITEIQDTASRKRPQTKPRHQMTIDFERSTDDADDDMPKATRRRAGAVRWAMTWVAAAAT